MNGQADVRRVGGWPVAVLTLVLGSMYATGAVAQTTADCDNDGHAPAAFDALPCDGDDGSGGSMGGKFCRINGPPNTMICARDQCDVRVVANLTYDYDGSGEISAWGTCNDGGVTYEFCCQLNDPAAGDDVEKIIFGGADGDDTLRLNPDDVHLQEHIAGQLLKVGVLGGEDNDELYGSDRDSAYYKEWFFGEAGIDGITTGAGKDFASGGDDRDHVSGQDGDDTVYGDKGKDTVSGGNDEDCVIDDPLCATVDGVELYGNDQDDTLWIARDGTGCSTDFLVNGGAHTVEDTCGDSDWGTTGTWTGCEAFIDTFPSQCTFPTLP